MGDSSPSEGYLKVPQNGHRFMAPFDRHFHCPACGSRKLYVLSDERRKCTQCEKKFTPRFQKHRLPKDMIKEIFRLFCLMAPASRVAKDLEINRKTVLIITSAIKYRKPSSSLVGDRTA